MADPVTELREALAKADECHRPTCAGCLAETREAARALLDALPEMMKAERDVGYEIGHDDCAVKAYETTEIEYSIHEPATLHGREATRIRTVICIDDATHCRRVGPWRPVPDTEKETQHG